MRPVTQFTVMLSASTVLLASCSSPTVPGRSTQSPANAARSVDAVDIGLRDDDDTAEAKRAIAEVTHASDQEVQAFLANDPATLAGLWSDEFVVTNPFNQFVTKQQVLGLVTSGVLAFSSYQRDIEYSRAYGKIVIVAGSETVVWAGRIPLAGQTSRLRYTAVWARHGGAWQEVARHANIVSPSSPSGPPVGAKTPSGA